MIETNIFAQKQDILFDFLAQLFTMPIQCFEYSDIAILLKCQARIIAQQSWFIQMILIDWLRIQLFMTIPRVAQCIPCTLCTPCSPMYPMCHSVSHAPKCIQCTPCSHSPTENKYPTRLCLVSKNWSGKGLFLVGEKFAIPHWIGGHVSFYMGYGR